MRNVNFISQTMQEPFEKLALDDSSIRVISNQPTISRGVLSPYLQQANDINHMSPMAIQLWGQLKNLEGRASSCIKAKDETIKDLKRKNEELETHLRRALAEAHYWKVMADNRTVVCKDLAGRLLKIRRKEMAGKMIAENNFAEDVESSTGENVDIARTRKCKRRRV